jgi:hypothetical protein
MRLQARLLALLVFMCMRVSIVNAQHTDVPDNCCGYGRYGYFNTDWYGYDCLDCGWETTNPCIYSAWDCHVYKVGAAPPQPPPPPPPPSPPLPQDCGPGLTGVAGNCTDCNPSTYKSSTGSDACTVCPLNSHHELKAQTSVSACVCDPGYMMFDLETCTPVEKKDTVSVSTSNTNSGSRKHYTDSTTILWIMLMTVTVLLE